MKTPTPGGSRLSTEKQMKSVSASIAYNLYCADAYLPHTDHLCAKLDAMRDTVSRAHPSQAAVAGTMTIWDSDTSPVGDEIISRINRVWHRRLKQLGRRRDTLRAVFEGDPMYVGAPC
jgi:hypothetical protein